MDSQSATPEKRGIHHGHTMNIREVDVAAGLDLDEPLDPNVAARIKYGLSKPNDR